MTVAPEITSIRNCSDFLIMVDIHISAKITVAKGHAAQFSSQSNLSAHIKDSLENYMIPCLLWVRGVIEQTAEILRDGQLKGESYDARHAYALVASFLETKNMDLEKIKEGITEPAVIAGMGLIQGIYIDIIEEMKPMTNKQL
ncbi:hypothetical protein [Nostoc sp. UHCC 0252]|uniref:hypothetical protein n=1 Tax=Nostoc sp. UHCC 0252 TaxID=3110241 RepID=UPI002B209A9C|nr:hypothetical protein [Nostoc sp. UHCC 0252]MEA5603725.1 hypothetical protein [Nostoc sp. UHCC 0252]